MSLLSITSSVVVVVVIDNIAFVFIIFVAVYIAESWSNKVDLTLLEANTIAIIIAVVGVIVDIVVLILLGLSIKGYFFFLPIMTFFRNIFEHWFIWNIG